MKTKDSNSTTSASAKALRSEVPARDTLTTINSIPQEADVTQIPGFYNDDGGWDGVPDPPLTHTEHSVHVEPEEAELERDYRRIQRGEQRNEESFEDHQHDRYGSDPSSAEISALKLRLSRIREASRDSNGALLANNSGPSRGVAELENNEQQPNEKKGLVMKTEPKDENTARRLPSCDVPLSYQEIRISPAAKRLSAKLKEQIRQSQEARLKAQQLASQTEEDE